MWILLIIMLAPNVSGQLMEELESFATEHECQTVRDQVGRDMADSYPNEADFRLVCWYRPRGH